MSAGGGDAASRSGEVIAGKYRLHRRLGTGGMAEVWSATNRFTERQVAIKLLSHEITEKEPETKRRFLNEAKVSARIDHPNIIEIIDVGQTDAGQLFIVMELLNGVTLETALHRQVPPMTFHELAHVMIDVASAMEAAHAANVVHRDLKPANIFLHKTRTGVRPTVLDFGVAKFRTAPTDRINPELTIAGTVLGSPLYMSPEQARGETDVDGRADIFAFGGILFEAVTGHRAFEAKNFNALIVKIATTRPKNIDEDAPRVPESLRKVVRVCLEPILEQRAPSFGHVLTLLRAAVPDLAKSNQRLPSVIAPAAVFDPEATSAMPVFPVPEHTRYEAALAPRVKETSSPPSPWLVFLVGGIVIAGLAFAARARPTTTSAALPSATPPPSTSTELVVASSPKPCRLTVDGVDRGETPVTITAPGEHEIACTASGQTRTTKTTLGAGTTSRYRFVFE